MPAFKRKFVLLEGEPGAAGGGGGTPPTPKPPTNPVLALPDDLIPEAWKDHVRDLRREHKKLRELQETMESTHREEIKRITEEFTAKMTDAAKASDTAANEKVLRSELKAEALKAGMVDLDGLKLADLSNVKLKEDGTIEGAEAMLKALKEAKPYLFGATQNSSPPGTPPSPKPPAAKHAKDMTPEEYAVARKQFK